MKLKEFLVRMNLALQIVRFHIFQPTGKKQKLKNVNQVINQVGKFPVAILPCDVKPCYSCHQN